MFSWSVPDSPTAIHVLTGHVDPANQIAESDETNNSLQQQVLHPDLRVASAVATLVGGDSVVSALIRNDGPTPVVAPFDVVLRQDDPAFGPILASTTIRGPLAVGAEELVELRVANASDVLRGSRTAFVVADGNSHVTEFDEENNAAAVRLHAFSSWTNPFNALDVNFDALVLTTDVIALLRELSQRGSRRLPVPAEPPLFVDVNGDRLMTSGDLIVLLRSFSQPSGGEGSGEEAAPMDQSGTPWPPSPIVSPSVFETQPVRRRVNHSWGMGIYWSTYGDTSAIASRVAFHDGHSNRIGGVDAEYSLDELLDILVQDRILVLKFGQ